MSEEKPILLILGHGSSKHQESSASVRRHAELIADNELFAEVRVAFLKEEPLIDECLIGLENKSVVIVPDFLAEGYFTRNVIPKKLNLSNAPAYVRYCPPVGTHPLMSELLISLGNDVLQSWKPEKTSMLVIGHGSGKNACSKQTLKHHLAEVRGNSSFGQVADLWLEEKPFVRDWSEVADFDQVVVIPFLLNDGQHGGWDIPCDLGIKKEATSHGVIHKIKDKHLKLAPALGKSDRFVEVILEMARVWGRL